MLTMTDNARAAIRALVPQDAPDAGLRIASSEPPADGQGIPLTLGVSEQPQPGDQVVNDEGARVFLDGEAAQLLDAQTLDARLDEGRKVSFYLR